MKPRIRWSNALGAWVVQEPTRAAGVPLVVLRESWPQALAWVGIPTPEGWR